MLQFVKRVQIKLVVSASILMINSYDIYVFILLLLYIIVSSVQVQSIT